MRATLAVGDFVFGYMLQLLRPWNFFSQQVYESKEFKRIRNTVRGVQLNELTLGVLGMGRVGRRVGRIATQGFGMRVIGEMMCWMSRDSSIFPDEAMDKERLYREADVLSIHVTMLPGNENLVGAEQIAADEADGDFDQHLARRGAGCDGVGGGDSVQETGRGAAARCLLAGAAGG